MMNKLTLLLLVVLISVAFTSIVSAEKFYVAGTNEAGYKFTAQESGIYQFTIVNGAFSPYPTDAEDPKNPPYWGNNIHILNNTPVRWVHLTDPDRWGADFDYYLGTGVKYQSRIAAQTAGKGKFVDIPIDANKYVILISPDTQGQYSDNRGGIYVSVAKLSCDFRVRPNIEKCFGGIGVQCNGFDLLLPQFIKDEDTCKVTGYMSGGSILHDKCCINSSNTGVRCAPRTINKNLCAQEWRIAENDVLKGVYWDYAWEQPYYSGGKGDSKTFIATLKAPPGKWVVRDYKWALCPTGSCASDGKGTDIIVKYGKFYYCQCL